MTRSTTNGCDDSPSAMPSRSPQPTTSAVPSYVPSYDPAGKISLCAKSTSSSTGITRVVQNALVECFDYDDTNVNDFMISGNTGSDGCILLQYEIKK